ncbi:acyl-CoA/acyl-ACP dehydrogenase [Komagataeibacter sp. AV436]|uniref:Acyl-CoA/acyl-ACP dehydrogenase n=1 Tax=Komagataeibacter melomenusus TaxID=2766578 RepID=A0ABX2A9R8_9PROT|nr:acyl-CoA dehydrogenase family protein [Komagataeibacter melomenusus]MBV1829640.1 acyl-CoA/acyl-ACP dehydrogenase [Komagataeibacter melomenusus]NPC65159.1 acyl-CoA/acyl-ACP dehydrogenase [Komagataeibacter melomenusus]
MNATPPSRTKAALTDMAARFAQRAAAYDRSGEIATDNLDDVQAAGLLGLTIARADGGQGGGLRQIVEVIGTLAKGDPTTALIVGMHYLQHAVIAKATHWPEAARRQVIETALREGALINALRVEPELGTPSRGGLPGTRITWVDGRPRLNGRKIYSTGSTALRWGTVWAATDEPEPRVGQVLVDLTLPGVSIERSWNQMGMRATGSHTIVFDNVELPDTALVDLRAPDAWHNRDGSLVVGHVLAIACLYDGVARAARDWLITFLHERVPTALGRPLATLPRFQTLLGEIDALLMVNESLIETALARAESGNYPAHEANLAKYVVTENAIKSVELGLAAIGNPGLSQDNPLERHYRNVLCARIHTPQADVALASAGRVALEAGQ